MRASQPLVGAPLAIERGRYFGVPPTPAKKGWRSKDARLGAGYHAATVWRLCSIALALVALIATSCASDSDRHAMRGRNERGSPSAAPSEGPTESASGSGAPASASTAAAIEPVFASTKPVSILIRRGTVVDGTGERRRVADVVIEGDAIAFVGRVADDQRANTVIDAKGLVVAPGFIDTHAHTDAKAKVDHLLAMGVTTILVGQDGTSDEDGVAAYLDEIDRAHPGVNVATLIGHATVRSKSGAGNKKTPSREELAKMSAAVQIGMEEGAFGLSTGLEYDPGGFAGPLELAAVAKPVGSMGGIVMSHLRSEDDDAIEGAIDELLTQCESTGARAHVAHLKIVLGKGKARAGAVLDKLARARARGMQVTADVYPYIASFTTLAILFPAYARPPHDYPSVKSKRRKDLLAHLEQRVNARNGPAAMLFGTGKLKGLTLAQAATRAGKPFPDVLLELGPNGAAAAYFVMDEEVMKTFLADPFVSFSTDGAGHGTHPRGFGAFSRIFGRYVTDDGPLTLELAVHKASALAATTIGLPRRGTIEAGSFADVIVFDPKTFIDRATFEKPEEPSVGMRDVVVGGVVEMLDGKPTDRRGGRALRRAKKSSP